MSMLQCRTAPKGAVLVWAAALCLARPAVADDAAYRDALIAEAEVRKLASAPAWAHLLHVEPAAFGPDRSTVESRWFFVADDGATDPAAELRATLAAFFDPAPRAPRAESAQCQFGARFAWLDAQLGFDRQRLPRQSCAERDSWMSRLAPEQVWVVFPSAYVNSPASMFGHTLLRLDGPEVTAATPLLAYAANYVAETQESNGLLFAVKGLTGGYVGQYSLLPYYDKVKEYARLESRDLWEYPLTLDAAARERLLLHLWELRGAAFTYYFFTKNCSYQLLTLLRVADPGIDWHGQFSGWAIPTDTLRVLAPRLGPPKFRPALGTSIRAQGAALSTDDRQAAAALSSGAATVESRAAAPSAAVLTLANDLLQYRFAAGDVKREDGAARSLSLLRARAATGEKGGRATPAAPVIDPVQGHGTSRVAVGTQLRPDGTDSLQLEWRAAYHDLLDPPGGYGDGQSISFFDIGLRTRLANGATTLDHATVIDIVSIAPRDVLFQPISWRFRAAHERPDLGLGRDPRITVLEGGPGLAWGRFDRVVGYGNLELRTEVGNARDQGYSLQAGPRLGLLARPLPGWTVLGEARWLPGGVGDHTNVRSLGVEQQWAIDRATGLRLGVQALWRDGAEARQLTLRLVRYF